MNDAAEAFTALNAMLDRQEKARTTHMGIRNDDSDRIQIQRILALILSELIRIGDVLGVER